MNAKNELLSLLVCPVPYSGVDTSTLPVTAFTDGAPEDRGGFSSSGLAALIGTLEIAEVR